MITDMQYFILKSPVQLLPERQRINKAARWWLLFITAEILYLGLIQFSIHSAIVSLNFEIWFWESNLTNKSLFAVLCFPWLQFMKKIALETVPRVLTMVLFLLEAVLRTLGFLMVFYSDDHSTISDEQKCFSTLLFA